MEIEEITTIGTGIIGGSIAKKLCNYYKINAISHDAVGDIFHKIAIPNSSEAIDLLGKSKVLIITAPLLNYEEIFAQLSKISHHDKTIIECGSVKVFTKNLAEKYGLKIQFTHPIAGLEKSGFSHSKSDLFIGKTIVYNTENVEKSREIFSKLGFSMEYFLTPEEHDEIYGKISHFIQLIAFIFKDFIDFFNLKDVYFQNLLVENFANFVRLFNSSREVWRGEFGIFSLNFGNISKTYADFLEFLSEKNPDSVAKIIKIIQEFIQENFGNLSKYFGQAIKDLLAMEVKFDKEIDGEKIKEFFKNIDLKLYAK